jgi:hypothetical protein
MLGGFVLHATYPLPYDRWSVGVPAVSVDSIHFHLLSGRIEGVIYICIISIYTVKC